MTAYKATIYIPISIADHYRVCVYVNIQSNQISREREKRPQQKDYIMTIRIEQVNLTAGTHGSGPMQEGRGARGK